jgi:hypothetical protein
MPSEEELTVIICFRKLKGQNHLEHQFHARNMLLNQIGILDDDEAYPFHNNIGVFVSFIDKVILNNRNVVLKNEVIVTVEDVINGFNRLM